MPLPIDVTVLVAVFNGEKHVGRCLRSLLTQICPSVTYQVMVVNDGSTDLTPYALSLFTDGKHSKVKQITLKENLGLPSALNTGLTHTDSKYVVRVDSDDFVNQNFINFLHLYLETNEQIGAVACDYYLVDEAEKVIKRQSAKTHPIACGVMFRRNLLESIGAYNPAFKINEEKELMIRFAKKYKVSHLTIPLYRYRKHSGNMTNDANEVDKYDQLLKEKFEGG